MDVAASRPPTRFLKPFNYNDIENGRRLFRLVEPLFPYRLLFFEFVDAYSVEVVNDITYEVH
jgi:hypothetical protein